MCNLRMLSSLAILLLAVDASFAQSDVDKTQCPYCDTEYGVFRHGETWTEQDPCIEYICNRGQKLQNVKSCPDLDCGGDKKILLPGHCCQQCATEPLIIDWSEWSGWGSCSESCGGGSRLRTRFCNDSLATESMDIIIRCSGRTLDEEQCNMQPCPVHGNWSDWTPFGTCSESCGGGTKHRFRTCTNPEPDHGGRECEGPAIDSMDCNTHPCPIDGVWKNWTEWSSCSVTCGPGVQERTRTCTQPQHGGMDCQGPSVETKNCNDRPCPIDGVWKAWSAWDECSVTCGGGNRSRSRQCIPPQHNGSDCDGPSVETEDCNEHPCPVHGEWNEWSDWSNCSKPCGNGTWYRTRTCRPPLHGGRDCVGNAREDGMCNTHHCPIDGVWSEWGDWSQCTVTCGGGIQERSRTCTPPKYNGKWCEGNSTDFKTCKHRKCPVNGYWMTWSNWTACSVSCEGGTRERRRQCVPPRHGGEPCEGSNRETEECNTHRCPINGKWSEWSIWSGCSVTCGEGLRSRSRTCEPPQFGGKDCEGSPTAREVCLKSACIDACRPNPCYRGVLCLNSPDSLHTYKCDSCPVGMSGNGSHCEFVNECVLANPCAEGVACKDLRRGWKCGACPKGYSGNRPQGPNLITAWHNKQICSDIDECKKKKSCHKNAECFNTIGSHTCTCKQYYKGDGKTCTVDNACLLGKHNCGRDDWCSNLGDGKFICQCPLEYVGDGIICLRDSDLDGIINKTDNCPETPNSGQEDADGDGLGDACDDDADNDEIKDAEDNCKFIKNVDQKDADKDGVGDVCDNCPTWWNDNQIDSDGDGQGDVCDRDRDNDGVISFSDNCPTTYNPDRKDTDRDGVGDACDNCKLVRNIDQRDEDEDGVGNGCDTDIDVDKDGIQDGKPDGGRRSFDNCQNQPNADQLDTDSDGLGDACDDDDDNDGINDAIDNCPKVYNPSQNYEDCDNDCDADGVSDAEDACPCNKDIQMANFNNFKSISLAKNHAGSSERHAVWALTANGSDITQTVDNHPAILLGQHRFMDVEFNGTFFVNDVNDDDYAGFVFNYQSNKRFIVVAWKKTNETYGTTTPFISRAMSGIQVKVVDSKTGPGNMLRNALWKTGDTNNEVRTIWYDKNFVGWEYKTAYFWNMKYNAESGCMRLKFFSGSKQIVDTGCVCDKTIIGGKIGVFSFSQANVIWSKIRYTCITDNQCALENSLGRTSRR